MADFSKRSSKKEMLDEENIPSHLLNRNLKELSLINRWLGGHLTTILGIKQFVKKHNLHNQEIIILDIACGGGDNISVLNTWAKKKGYRFQFIGLDLKQEAIDFAKLSHPELKNCQWVCASFEEIPQLDLKFDIAITALFCHHLSDEKIKELVKIAVENSRYGLVVNDLHRHPLAYYGIKLLTGLFSRSPLVKNDAPLSVLRGFRKEELKDLFKAYKTKIRWIWAFRWGLVVEGEGDRY
ncbi:MAG: methyltransferase domain-containing protein [Cytophagales bacterium]